MVRGLSVAVSTKKKLNTMSSTESQMVGVDWTRFFLLEQGYGVIDNLLLQDNKSLIMLERNGKASSCKCTRPINIHYFFI
jgi:hypothetical protein